MVLPSVPEQPPDETANSGFLCLVGGDNRAAKGSAVQRSLATNVKRKHRTVSWLCQMLTISESRPLRSVTRTMPLQLRTQV